MAIVVVHNHMRRRVRARDARLDPSNLAPANRAYRQRTIAEFVQSRGSYRFEGRSVSPEDVRNDSGLADRIWCDLRNKGWTAEDATTRDQQQFWAEALKTSGGFGRGTSKKLGMVGPYSSRQEAESAAFSKFPDANEVQSGYGNGGAYADIRWRRRDQ